MSKKSRRARAKFKPTQQVMSREQVRQSEPAKVEVVPRIMRSTAEPSSLSQTARYQHIVPELIRIAIISGVLFIITIILSSVIK